MIDQKRTITEKQTQFDVIVIGAGLLGCFMARNLRRYDLSVLVLEQGPDVCTGISKANTGIIYPGYDMATGSLKAKLTVKACREFPRLCETLGVPFNPCGSLMVGFGPNGKKSIEKKLEKGAANGVSGLKLLNPEECLALEPAFSPDVVIGLYSPDTCTVNPWDLCIAGYENAAANGACFQFHTEVTGIRRECENGENYFYVAARRSPEATESAESAAPAEQAAGDAVGSTPAGDAVEHGPAGCISAGCVPTMEPVGSTPAGCMPERTYRGRCVINCAGLSADDVHEMLSAPSVRLNPTGADYFLLEEDPGQMPSHVIFHEPEEKGKGLTIIPTVDKNTLVGPTEREHPDLDGNPTIAAQLSDLMESCHKYLPAMPTEQIIHTFGSTRPNPFEVFPDNGEWGRSKKRLPDFNILEENGFISLIGVKTPGLTCCNVLGEYIAEKVTASLGNVSKNPNFQPRRPKPVRVHGLPFEKRAALIKTNPDYGRIICSCRDISEAEVRAAIRRGGHTLDGVKRRCGVLMGNCQGSRCFQKVLEIMAEELGCKPSEIEKERRGSGALSGNVPSGTSMMIKEPAFNSIDGEYA